MMTVEELIKRLSGFDEKLDVVIDVKAECGCLDVKCGIDGVQFKHYKCALTGNTDF